MQAGDREAFVHAPRLSYDPDTDVVQATFAERVPADAVAVPGEDLTILVSESLGRVVAIDVQDLPSFVRRYVPELAELAELAERAELAEHAEPQPPSALRGEELFAAARPHIETLLTLCARNLGPPPRESVRLWTELAQRESRTSS